MTTELNVEGLLLAVGTTCPAPDVSSMVVGFVNFGRRSRLSPGAMTLSAVLSQTSAGMSPNGAASFTLLSRPVCVVVRYPQNMAAAENVPAGTFDR